MPEPTNGTEGDATPTTEVKVETTPDVSAEALMGGGTQTPDNQKETDTGADGQTVPLAKFLELKKEVKTLRSEKAKPSEPDGSSSSDEVDALAQKFNVDPKFIGEMMEASTAKAKKEIEEKYGVDIEGMKKDKQMQEFDAKFNTAYSDAVEALKAEGYDIPETANSNVLKQLSLANPKAGLKSLLQGLYTKSDNVRHSSETDTRPAVEVLEDVVDVANITPELEARLMKTKKGKAAYFAKLDELGM